ncbi:MAG: alpha/beta hydrolase [Desulfohalobiaceae bacterium]
MINHESNLHPRLQEWLQAYNAYLRQLLSTGFRVTPTNAREGLSTLTRQWTQDKVELPWIQDELILPAQGYQVPVRIYHPDPSAALPVLVYYHGGGHMAGSVADYDPICRRIAYHTQQILVSVDYRLAPECPYPAGLEDAVHSAKYVWAALESRNVAYQPRLRLGGDSAGGALSATVAHLAQYDPGLQVEAQILIYPSLDYTMSSPSIDEYQSGFLLQKQNIQWYFDNYFQRGEDRKKVSPLFMEVAGSYPATLVVSAGFCPLQDEAEAYVEKLRQGGITAEHLHFPDLMHAFMNMERLFPERIQELNQALQAFLSRDFD